MGQETVLSAEELAHADELRISPEVAWYLKDRGLGWPDCPPRWKTPEPRKVKGAMFDGLRVDRVLRSFKALRHTQGQWAGDPLTPDPWQVAYILAPVFGWVRWDDDTVAYVRIITDLYVEVSRKNGKALDVATPILTADGWKTMGLLKVGDQVHALDGTFAEVQWVSEVQQRPCFAVRFADGAELVASDEHQWLVNDRLHRGAPRVVDTAELVATQTYGRRGDRRYSVQVPGSLERPEMDLEFDPYLLGAWLGDGHTNAARITTADPEIITAFELAGLVPSRRYNTDNGAATTYAFRGLKARLRALGVLGNKHVPEQFLLASEKQRLMLLRGLMDTDGGVIVGPNTPRVEFCSTLPELANAVLFLARSLGWKATSKQSRAHLYGRDCGPRWRVTWTAHRDHSPFSLSRKTEQLAPSPAKATRARTNALASVKSTSTVPTVCIAVAHPSGCFLAGAALTPTHNSTLSGGIALYLTGGDGEEGAQVLAAATTENQAGFVFQPVKRLAESDAALKKHFRAYQKKILHPKTGSYFAVVSNVADAQHGGNIHGAVIDELHIHKTPDLVETIESGTGSRSQPLVCIITTADSGRTETIYDRKRKRIEQLARGALVDESVYGVVWCADVEDDPFVEATWKKANPGYGISPKRSYLIRKSTEAQQSPADLARFLRLHLGIRTRQETKYLDLPVWDRNASLVNEAGLAGRECYGGLDLASTSDLCALTWDFPDGAGGHDAIWRLWMPEAALEPLNRRTAGAAAAWVRDGFLTLTPGEVVDYDFILAGINHDREMFRVKEIGYDPWNSTQLVTDLTNAGAEMVTVRQGFATLSSPTKELKRLLLEGTTDAPTYRHGGNPCVRWQVDNFAVAMDAAGNVKPDKAAAGDKIDGVVSGIMALDRALRHQKPRKSAYEDRGLETVGQ